MSQDDTNKSIPGSIPSSVQKAGAEAREASDEWIHVKDLERLVEAWETKAEAFEMTSPIMDLSFAHAHRDCIRDLQTVISNNDQERQSGL